MGFGIMMHAKHVSEGYVGMLVGVPRTTYSRLVLHIRVVRGFG